jgi:hypothetical protein
MRAETIREEHGSGEKSRTETGTNDGTWPAGALRERSVRNVVARNPRLAAQKNGARRQTDCRALERIPEQKPESREEESQTKNRRCLRQRTGPMSKSQHGRRGSPNGADPRTAHDFSQRRRAVRETQWLGRCA